MFEDTQEPDDVQDSSEGNAPPQTAEVVTQVMRNPQVLAALQDQLGELMGRSSGYIESLPKEVKRRIKALKNIQVACTKLEGQFYEEVHALECKYAEKFKTHYEKRQTIVTGAYEPNEEECKFDLDEDDEEDEDEENKEDKDAEELATEAEQKLKLNSDEKADVETEELPKEDTKGIPEFWLTAMKNIDILQEMIIDHDEPILKHLADIKLVFTNTVGGEEGADDKPGPKGFVLEFHFEPNAYFTNKVLTKSYFMKWDPDETDPFSYEGPEIISCNGCKIDWKKGKNVTQKVVKKKQRHKGKGQTRFINKTVKNDSFFNFFAPPVVPEEEADMDEETEQLLASDFEIGHFFRERLIPRAVLYFTGEAMEDDEFEEEDDDEGGDLEGLDEDEDEDEDPDYDPSKEGSKPEECKQQ